MAHYTYHASRGCDIDLPGDSLADAICSGFSAIARDLGLGNAAGFRLYSVRAEHTRGILGGKGGIVVSIRHSGLPLASGCAMHCPSRPGCPHEPPVRRTEAWIEGKPADCPDPIDIRVQC
jgi:hypothetical protein